MGMRKTKCIWICAIIVLIMLLLSMLISAAAHESICPEGSNPRSDIIWCADFENYDDPACITGNELDCAKANNLFSNSGTFSILEGDAAVGEGAISGSSAPGGTGPGYCQANFPQGAEAVNYRFYVKFKDGYLQSAWSSGNHGPSIEASGTGCYLRASLDWSAVGAVFILQGDCGPTSILSKNLGNVVLKNNRWYLVEMQFIMNNETYGLGIHDGNGIGRAWIDGVKILEYTDLNIRGNTDAKFSSAWTARSYYGMGVPAWNQSIFYDNFAVSDNATYIGPAENENNRGTADPNSPYANYGAYDGMAGHRLDLDCSSSGYLGYSMGWQWGKGAELQSELTHGGYEDKCSGNPDKAMRIALSNGDAEGGGKSALFNYNNKRQVIHGWIYLPSTNDHSIITPLSGPARYSAGSEKGNYASFAVLNGKWAILNRYDNGQAIVEAEGADAVLDQWHEFEFIYYQESLTEAAASLMIDREIIIPKTNLTSIVFTEGQIGTKSLILGVIEYNGESDFNVYYDDVDMGSISFWSCEGWSEESCPFKTTVSACPEEKITSDCQCGENAYNAGYCCQGIWFDSSYEDISNGCPSGDFYFVDQNNPNANDSNAGTEELPWKTIDHAAEILTAGDTVLVRGGTYNVGTGNWEEPAVNPSDSGTADSPIVFRAYPGEKVEITGTSKVIGSRDRNYIIWDRFTVLNGGVLFFGDAGIRVKGCIVQNCILEGKYSPTTDNNDLISLHGTSGTIIRNCTIRNQQGDSWNSAGIKFYYNDNVIVEDCEIYNNTVGIFDKDWSINNTYRRNIFYDNKILDFLVHNQAGPSHNSHGNNFYENIFVNKGIGFDNDPGMNFSDLKFYNNVFYNCGILPEGTPNLRIWNNIFNTDGYAIIAIKNGTPVYSNHNIFYPAAKFITGKYTGNEKVYENLAEWQSGTALDSDSLNQDPLFVDAENKDFHLLPDSPCIGSGLGGANIGAYPRKSFILPTRSNPQPSGTLPAGTAQATISLDTNENAECRYSTASGTAYADMADTFTTTGGMSHSQLIEGLQDGQSYAYHARCSDTNGNFNTDDFLISFSIGTDDDADTDKDGKVSITELIAHIGRWKRGEVDMLRLMTAVGRWFRGE